MYANLAAAYCALTDRCESEGLQAAQTAANIDRELGQLDHLAVPLIVMAQIHQCQGELQQAQDAYREALALAEKAGEPQLLFPVTMDSRRSISIAATGNWPSSPCRRRRSSANARGSILMPCWCCRSCVDEDL